MVAVSVIPFWTFRRDDWFNRATAVITDGPWAHMGLAFRCACCAGVYYEALRGEGFVGPLPLERLIAWGAKPGHRLCLGDTRIDAAMAERMRHECDLTVADKRIGYWAPQLPAMALMERFWIPVRHSPRQIVCSEIASRILAPGMDLRDRRRKRFDEVNPNSAWRRYCEIQAGHGSVSAPPSPAR
jgi:hypothetical protein